MIGVGLWEYRSREKRGRIDETKLKNDESNYKAMKEFEPKKKKTPEGIDLPQTPNPYISL